MTDAPSIEEELDRLEELLDLIRLKLATLRERLHEPTDSRPERTEDPD
jgi:hypothetical protein